MSNDDTFFGSGGGGDDRTLLKPTPGGRGRRATQMPPAGAPPPVAPGVLPRVDRSDTNALTAAATPLLSLAGRLASTTSHSDPASLSRHIVNEIQAFESAATSAGALPESVMTARYALCTLIDEIVLNTPWGSQSSWASQTLLSIFHKEAWGGEKFFQVLDRLLQQPAANLDLLELMYLCMSMGLQGQYRVYQDGRAQLETVRSNVYQALRTHRRQPDRDLSPHWKGVEDTQSPLSKAVPLWVVGAVCAGIALVVYVGFLYSLNTASDPVAVEVASMGRNIPPIVERRGFVQERQLRLADLLQSEIQRGDFELIESNGIETVRVRALFSSGSAEVNSLSRALLSAVGQALTQIPGRVLVTGHTDDVPSRSLRFPSNWHLSKSRAEAVATLLSAAIPANRLVAEPRADSDPLVPNSSPQNRATNRRVEITLFTEPGRE